MCLALSKMGELKIGGRKKRIRKTEYVELGQDSQHPATGRKRNFIRNRRNGKTASKLH